MAFSLFKKETKLPLKTKVKGINKNFFACHNPLNPELILPVASWEREPDFTQGRSGYLKQEGPNNKNEGTCLKIKGTGNFEGKKTPPGKGSFLPRILTFYCQVEENGQVKHFLSPPKPKGGMLAKKAEREFRITSLAWENGLPVAEPVLWGEYPKLEYEENTLGFVALHVPSYQDYRIRNILDVNAHPESQKKFTASSLLTQSLGGMEKMIITPDIVEQWFNSYALKLGQGLRSFHQSGIYHLQCDPGNTHLPWGKEKLYFYDLDGAFSAEELTETQQVTYQFIDLQNAFGGLAQSLTQGMVLVLSILQESKRFNPYIQLLKGYLGRKAFDKILKNCGEARTTILQCKELIQNNFWDKFWLAENPKDIFNISFVSRMQIISLGLIPEIEKLNGNRIKIRREDFIFEQNQK